MSLEETVTITISKEILQKMKFDAADISCWFMGFSAACDDSVNLPPGLRDFEFQFNAMLRKVGI